MPPCCSSQQALCMAVQDESSESGCRPGVNFRDQEGGWRKEVGTHERRTSPALDSSKVGVCSISQVAGSEAVSTSGVAVGG